MRRKKEAKLHRVVLMYPNNMIRTVSVKATTREVAENRALKRNPNALGVKRNA